jgi:hypothetical protein
MGTVGTRQRPVYSLAVVPLSLTNERCLRLLQAQADCGGSRALRTIGRAATWTEHRHQGFAGIATHRAVDPDRTGARRCGIALVTLVTGFALRPLWSPGAGGTLIASLMSSAGNSTSQSAMADALLAGI